MIGVHGPAATAVKAGIGLAMAGGLVLQPYRVMMVVGGSMEPTYADHSVLLTEPVAADELARGMVVIVNMNNGPIVKRVGFMPGDKIVQVMIDNKWFDLPYYTRTDRKAFRYRKWRDFTIPAGEVYVLGDNNIMSEDSRYFGPVPMSHIDRRLVDRRPIKPLPFSFLTANKITAPSGPATLKSFRKQPAPPM